MAISGTKTGIRSVSVAALLLPSITTSFAFSIPLALRDNLATCPANSGLEACPASLPFCCPKDTKCTAIPATKGKSVICCPSDDCSVIKIITCDISQQNAALFPSNLLHTTDLHTPLQKCGDECCPQGYSCQGGTACVMEDKSSSAPSTSTSTPSATTSAPVIIPTKLNDSSASTGSSSPDYPARAVILGLFLGLIFGALIAVALLCYLRRRRKQQDGTSSGSERSKSSHSSKGHRPFALTAHSRTVSDPVVATEYGATHRTDFLLRRDLGKNGTPVETPQMMEKAKTPPSGRQQPLFPSPLRFGLPSSPRHPPPIPELVVRDDEPISADEFRDSSRRSSASSTRPDPRGPTRKGSAETISVRLMPPAEITESKHKREASRLTTLSGLMESAGLRRGEGYLGYPGRWSFRK